MIACARLAQGFRAALPLVLCLQIPSTFAATTDADIRQGWLKHAAQAQLHRWFQVYERPGSGIDNALDALSDDIFVKSGEDTTRGREAYAERLATLPANWKNANTVNSSEVRVLDEQSLELDANVTYLNQGMREDGGVRSTELNFQTRLERDEEILPRFNQIGIQLATESDTDTYQDAYAHNRLLSLVHYFLAVIEHPDRDPAPITELLTRTFRLKLATGSITSYPAFAAWLQGPLAQVLASTHKLHHFTYDTLDEDERYVLTMELDWFGVRADGTRLNGKTRQIWTVINVVGERFARIQSIDEEVLEAVAPLAD